MGQHLIRDRLFVPLQMGAAPSRRGMRDQARGGTVTRRFGSLVDDFANHRIAAVAVAFRKVDRFIEATINVQHGA